MKWLILGLTFVSSCLTHRSPDSYFLIESSHLAPCTLKIKGDRYAYLFKDKFDLKQDSIRFVFSIKSLKFVDQNKKNIDQNLPVAGNMGSYNKIKMINIFIRNDKYPNYYNVSGSVYYDSLENRVALFFLTDSDIGQLTLYDSLGFKSSSAKTINSFKRFSELLNSSDPIVKNRGLTRTDLKPYIAFAVSKEFFVTGSNSVRVDLGFDGYTVSSELGIEIY